MRGRDIVVMAICLAMAAGLFWAAGAQLDYINAQRHQMGLVVNEPLENAPPSLAFATVAMGAFRGLVVDILWMRADKLKEEGQFFDAKQLAEWITTLQPRFAAVWEFHAWNMAYNISVAIPASQPEQRWRWVKNGYELLRDKGIPTNPKAVQLYRELARIFQHKLGGVSDDAHKYYKLQLAEAIGPLLGSEDNHLSADDNAFYDALIAMPTEWARIAGDPNAAPFIEALQAIGEPFTGEQKFVQNYLALRRNTARFPQAAFDVVDRFRGTMALQRFDLFAKAYELRNTWKLEPARMQQVSREYGPIDFADPNVHLPLDWRHPDSHAIYWALKGLSVAKENKDPDAQRYETNTQRIVAHSLQNLFRYGKIMILNRPAKPLDQEGPPDEAAAAIDKDVFLGPDLRMFNAYNKAILDIIAGYEDDRTTRESLENGHRNMLKNAVLSFYQAGLKGEALRIYNRLRQRYPMNEFRVSLEQYVINRWREELESLGIHDAREQIAMLLTEGYYLYAIRDDDAAAGRDQLAQQIYDHYNTTNEPEFRIDLPPMSVLRYFALGQFLNSGAYPEYIRLGLLNRIQIEKPELYKQLEQTEVQLRQMQEQGTP
ncbi:MAG: hypothetical protein RBR19_12755 [Sedimentisphaerales bacterium]|nr:hypothetical protein [Sedimentisphaerales bacterium]